MTRYPGAGGDHEGLHAGAGAVALLLAEPRVQNIDDPVDGHRRLCDVGGHHYLGGGEGMSQALPIPGSTP